MGIFNTLLKENSHITLEMINFQKDDFPSKLEALFTKLKEAIMTTERKRDLSLNGSPFKKEMEILIYDRFGIKTLFNFEYPTVGAVVVFPINQHNVLLGEEHRGHEWLDYFKEDTEILYNKKGTVDLRLAKLSGIFSTYRHPVFMDLWGNFKTWDLTPAEMTAIILHELGHIFTFYELSDRLESANQIMANLSKNLNNPEKKTYILKELGQKLDISQTKLDDLIGTNNRVILGQKLYEVYFGKVISQYSDSKYDDTSSEQLADQFVSRFGYGKYIVTGISKIDNESGLNNNVIYGFTFFGNYVFQSMKLIFAIMGLTVGVVGTILFVIVLLNILFSGDRFKSMTYDELTQRYKRIRDQYIDMIVKSDLSKEEMKKSISSIKEIDFIMKNTRSISSVFEKISNFVFTTNRSAYSTVVLQQIIEDVAHNDLYLKSAELRTV